MIGHDGSEVVFPELSGMNRRRNFHIQEIINVAWRLGYFLTPFQISPVMEYGLNCNIRLETNQSIISEALLRYDAILIFPGHAMAWSCKDNCIFDPRGKPRDLNELSPLMIFIVGHIDGDVSMIPPNHSTKDGAC